MVKNKKTPASSSKDNLEDMFPCFFPIKIVGLSSNEFETNVLTLIRKTLPDLKENAIQNRLSKEGKYLAITVTVWVQNKAQLDTIYQDLTKSPYVIMAL